MDRYNKICMANIKEASICSDEKLSTVIFERIQNLPGIKEKNAYFLFGEKLDGSCELIDPDGICHVYVGEKKDFALKFFEAYCEERSVTCIDGGVVLNGYMNLVPEILIQLFEKESPLSTYVGAALLYGDPLPSVVGRATKEKENILQILGQIGGEPAKESEDRDI